MEIDPTVALRAPASVMLHFKDKVSGIKLLAGQEREKTNTNPRYELRVDGPYIKKFQGVNEYRFEINSLITVNGSQEDIYLLEQQLQKVLTGFTDHIDLLAENGNKMGCLDITFDGRRDRIEVNKFGRIHKDIEILQASIEAHYIYEQS